MPLQRRLRGILGLHIRHAHALVQGCKGAWRAPLHLHLAVERKKEGKEVKEKEREEEQVGKKRKTRLDNL